MFYSICPNSNLEESQKFKEGLKDLLSYVPNNMQINVFKSILADSCFEMLNNIIEEEKKQNGGVGIIKKKGGILSCKEENLKFLIKSITNKHFSNRKISKDSNRKILKEKKKFIKICHLIVLQKY